MENMCRCQSLTVKEQLALGIRLFDIRLYKSGSTFYLCHSLADCFSDSEKKTKLTFDAVFEDLSSFLRENPDETLIVSIKQDRGIMNRFFFPSFYEKHILGKENQWYLKNEIPSLGACRGKMVLMRRCKVFPWWKKGKQCGLDFSHWKDQGSKRREKYILFFSTKSKKPLFRTDMALHPCANGKNAKSPFLTAVCATKTI